MRKIVIPNFRLLDFGILVFYYFKYNARKPPTQSDIKKINLAHTIFLAHNKYESVLICIYTDFREYLENRRKMINYLEENHIISSFKEIHEYNLDQIKFIKYFEFYPLLDKYSDKL